MTQSESGSGNQNVLLGDSPQPANPDEARPRALARGGALRNWKHEEFCRLVAGGTEPRAAYTAAGFVPNRANHNRLIREPEVKRRIEELRRERELKARAARMSNDQLLGELDSRGLDRIADLFERNAAGVVSVRNLEVVPVEVALAFLRVLSEGFRITQSVQKFANCERK